VPALRLNALETMIAEGAMAVGAPVDDKLYQMTAHAIAPLIRHIPDEALRAVYERAMLNRLDEGNGRAMLLTAPELDKAWRSLKREEETRRARQHEKKTEDMKRRFLKRLQEVGALPERKHMSEHARAAAEEGRRPLPRRTSEALDGRPDNERPAVDADDGPRDE
jgi:hypothetical protein